MLIIGTLAELAASGMVSFYTESDESCCGNIICHCATFIFKCLATENSIVKPYLGMVFILWERLLHLVLMLNHAVIIVVCVVFPGL